MDVVRCATHGVAFTIYPPGQVPYGREPLVELAPDGGELRRDATEESSPCGPSLFAASRDAAKGVRWPRDDAPGSAGGVRTTQRRHVARGARLLGLAERAPPGGATVAGVTGLAEGRLVEIGSRLESSRDLAVWGCEVGGVIADLTRRVGGALMDRLALLGHLAGFWGRPYRWLPCPGRLLELGRRFWITGDAGTRGGARTSSARSAFHDFGPRDPPQDG